MMKLPPRRCRHHSCLLQAGTALLLAAALAYTFSFYLWTNLPDPYYWYNNTPFYNDNCFESLTFFIGHVWRNIVGENVLLFRLLAWMMGLLSMSIPYVVLQTKEDRRRNLLWLALGLFVMGAYTQGMYNSDSPTVLLFVCMATWALKWSGSEQQCPSWKAIVGMSVLSGMLVAVRFPNVLVIPLCVVYLLVACLYRRNGWMRSLGLAIMYACASLCVAYGTIAFLIGNCHVVDVLVRRFSTVTQTASQDHTVGSLITGYIEDAKGLLLLATSLLGMYMLHCLFKTQRRWLQWGLDAVIFFLIYYVVYLSYWNIRNLVSASVIFLAWLYRYKHKGCGSLPYYTLLLVSLLGLIACAGSNTRFFKALPYYASFLPLVIALWQTKIRANRIDKGLILALLFWLLRYTLFSIMQFSPEGTSSTTICTYRVPSDMGYGFQLLQEEQYRIQHECMEDFEEYGVKGKTIFYGMSKAQWMYVLTDTKPYVYLGFHMTRESVAEIEKNVITLLQHPNLVLFDYTDSPLLAERLLALGYESVRTERGTVVWKKTK